MSQNAEEMLPNPKILNEWLCSVQISDSTPCAHAQSNILHMKYAEKSDD